MSEAKLLIGHKIKAIREMQGITQEYLADRIGMSQNNLSKIEKGEVRVSFEKACEIAASLEVDLNTMINFDKSTVFNNCSHSGYNNYNYNGVEEIKALYEKILFEKEERIKLLEARIK